MKYLLLVSNKIFVMLLDKLNLCINGGNVAVQIRTQMTEDSSDLEKFPNLLGTCVQ